MKTKLFFFAVLAGMVLTSCTSDDIIAEAPPIETVSEPEVPIMFSSEGGNYTRADITGSEAADLLGRKFVVTGYKGAKTLWDATKNSIVFDNYLVEYAENTANTTASNTHNWEYVGKGRIKHAIDNGITSQTIKYWDFSKDQYDFIAWSTGTKEAIYEGTPADGQVLVSAIKPKAATTPATGLADTYTFTGKAKDLTDCYISDLVTVKKADYKRQPVTLKFRALGSKVRIGIYETVPGYSVKDVHFYRAAAVALDESNKTTPVLFTTTANNIYTQGKYTIYFPTVDNTSSADNNQAHIRFAGTGDQSTIVEFGSWDKNLVIREQGEKSEEAIYLGRSSNTATYAGEAEGNYYTQYLPNESGTNLNLRVNYTLESIDGSGEVIEVKGATAQVPLIYNQWKAGYAYTYLFKISDKTNGYTGAYDPTKPDDTEVNNDPAGLYPITFDALVVNAEEDATQETITTISTPSITTYQKGSKVIDNNEYLATTGPIFVTVNDGNAGSTPDLANGQLVALTTDNAALYTIPDGKTEAEVIDAMQMRDDDAADNTVKGRSGLVLTKADNELVNKVEYGVDGNTIDLKDENKTKAMKFTATAAGTYAFVYTKKAATADGTTVKYQALNWESFASGQTKYRYDYKDIAKSHTYNNGTADVDAYDAQKGALYFKADATTGVYAKVTPFIGQGVSNMYLDATGTTIATGYSVTGTDYYYTVDGGQSYTKAANIAYASFATATDLYTYDGTTYTVKPTTVTTPVDGTAYYQRTGEGTEASPYVYTYCVILPEQTTGWKEADTSKYEKVGDTETAEVVGMTYFDKYTQNDGVYYAKVIKVQ